MGRVVIHERHRSDNEGETKGLTMIRNLRETKVEVRENMKGGTGKVTIRHYLQKDDFKANVRLCAHLTVPPGSGIGPHAHEKEDEVFIILKGSGIVSDAGRDARVSAGDTIVTGNGGQHAIRNDGTIDLEIVAMIMCYA